MRQLLRAGIAVNASEHNHYMLALFANPKLIRSKLKRAIVNSLKALFLDRLAIRIIQNTVPIFLVIGVKAPAIAAKAELGSKP